MEEQEEASRRARDWKMSDSVLVQNTTYSYVNLVRSSLNPNEKELSNQKVAVNGSQAEYFIAQKE